MAIVIYNMVEIDFLNIPILIFYLKDIKFHTLMNVKRRLKRQLNI